MIPEPASDTSEPALHRWLARADPAGSTDPIDALAAAREARALALAAGLGVEAARAGVWTCLHLMRTGRFAEVLVEADALRPELAATDRDTPLGAEWHELLRIVALAASEAAEFGVALDAAQELARASALRDEPALALDAAFAFATCLERMGDSWQALRTLGEAVERHGDAVTGLPLLAAVNGLAAISIGAFHRLRGVAPAEVVEAMLERAQAAAERARGLLVNRAHPLYEVVVIGNLGEIRMHQGDLEGAEPLLRHAIDLAGQRGLRPYGWRAQASVGAWLVARGRTSEARAMLEALLAELGDDGPLQPRIRARHAAYQACRAQGDVAAALVHFEHYDLLERQRATAQLRAQSELFVTRAETQRAQALAGQAQAEAARQRERARAASERAERDPLTGVGNRHLLERCFAELLPAAARERRPLAVVVLDVDHFKRINDRHGHAGGDAVLATLAGLLRESTRASDVLARLGGEEFVLLLPDLPRSRAGELCERLLERIAACSWPGLPPGERITASIGLAHAGLYDAQDLLRRADEALYAAKRSGRNRVIDAG